MMRQYEEAKRACPDALLLFRMGDFYELFHDDAKTAARVLGLALTSREKGENAVPMAGFPHHQLESYLGKLMAAGYRAVFHTPKYRHGAHTMPIDTDFMAALSRGVQGVGRNELPKAGDPWAELVHRAAEAGFKLMHAYGGLAATAQPDDLLAVWRSFHEECLEGSDRHLKATTAAYTAALYAHRTAAIITDDLVRQGLLSRYKAVIVSFENPPAPDLAARLDEFRRAGGLVLANRQSDHYWAPEGAIELGQAFVESHALAHSNRDTLRHVGIEEDGLKGAAVLLKALGDNLARFEAQFGPIVVPEGSSLADQLFRPPAAEGGGGT